MIPDVLNHTDELVSVTDDKVSIQEPMKVPEDNLEKEKSPRKNYMKKILKKEREEISCLIVKYHEDLKRLYIELNDSKQEFPVSILISDADIA